jgi:predicted site-specific integrase-resolvase
LGFEFILAALEASNRQVMVMNESEYKDDLVQDMADILTSLCARLYGQRGAAHRAKRALQAATTEPSEKER